MFARFVRMAIVWLLGMAALGHTQAATCFAVDDDSARIVVFDRDPPVTIRYNAPIPGFGSERIEAAYFDAVQNRYYVVDQVSATANIHNQVGWIDPFTGAFNPTSLTLSGTASVAAGTVQLGGGNGSASRIVGLTRNPQTNRWYVINQNGVVFEIDISTGGILRGAFSGLDGLQVRNPDGSSTSGQTVEDLAFDANGQLYVIKNDVGATQFLQRVNLITGVADAAANPGINESEGLALTNGALRLIVGAGGGTNVRNFYNIDAVTGAATLIFNLPNATTTTADYEAQGCNDSFVRADLALLKTVSPPAVPPGGTLTYTIVLVHQGIDPAYRVQVTDTLDAGLSVVSSTIHPSCTVCSFNTPTGVWTIDKIDIGQYRTLTLVVSTSGVPTNTWVNNRVQVSQACELPTGTCTALADFDSTPANKSGSWSPTEDDEAIAGALVTILPSVNKAFAPTSGLAGVSTTLVITLTNPNATVSGTLTAPLTDAYPAGIFNYSSPNAQTNCPSGVASAAAGGTTVTLASGALIPANGSCTVSVVVVANAVGVYANTIAVGSLTTAIGSNAVGSTAQYQVTPANVNVIKDFTPDAIPQSGSATLKITFSNPTLVTATFSSVFTDTYPTGLVNYTTPNPQTSCLGSGGPTADAGQGTVTLPVTRAVPPNGSCTITVVVTAASTGYYTNTIPVGSVSTQVGSNLGQTAAVLQLDPPAIIKSFGSSVIEPGQTTTLTIRFSNNLNTTATLTSLFTDVYPSGLRNATTTGVTQTCSTGSAAAASGGTTVTLAIGSAIPPLSTCLLRVNVTGNTTGTYTNSIPTGALTTTLGFNTQPATASLQIATSTNLGVTKTANISSGTPTTTITYTITVRNFGPSQATGATLNDLLNGVGLLGGMTITQSIGTATVTQRVTSTTSINLTMTLPASTSITIVVQATPTVYQGLVYNAVTVTAPVGAVDSNLNNNVSSVAVYISPTAALAVTKTNGVSSVVAGTQTFYTLTFTNSGPSSADGSVIRDVPDGSLECTAVTCSASGGAVCGSPSIGDILSGYPLPTFPSGGTVTVLLQCGVRATGQ